MSLCSDRRFVGELISRCCQRTKRIPNKSIVMKDAAAAVKRKFDSDLKTFQTIPKRRRRSDFVCDSSVRIIARESSVTLRLACFISKIWEQTSSCIQRQCSLTSWLFLTFRFTHNLLPVSSSFRLRLHLKANTQNVHFSVRLVTWVAKRLLRERRTQIKRNNWEMRCCSLSFDLWEFSENQYPSMKDSNVWLTVTTITEVYYCGNNTCFSLRLSFESKSFLNTRGVYQERVSLLSCSLWRVSGNTDPSD